VTITERIRGHTIMLHFTYLVPWNGVKANVIYTRSQAKLSLGYP